MRMRPLLFIMPLLALAACSGRDDASGGAPSLKTGTGPTLDGPMFATPGLWRTTTSVNGRQAFGANRACVDAGARTLERMGPDTAPAELGCGVPRRRAVPGGFSYDLACEAQGVRTLISGKITGDAKRVVMATTTRMTGPDGQAMPTAEVLVESLFVGPCPAGMQPGESIQEGVAPG
ncbi:MAG: hypothetical protein KBC34_14535 [Phenylobacterium sp.]|nr:hypothetical protein [Phenylobacterium sp.]